VKISFLFFLILIVFDSSNSSFDGEAVFVEQNNSLSDPLNDSLNEKYLIQPFVIGEVSDYRLEGEFAVNGSF